MYRPRIAREEMGFIPKREEKIPAVKVINCINCSSIIADGAMVHGRIGIICSKCGTRNEITATPNGVQA